MARYSFDEVDGSDTLTDSVGTADSVLSTISFVPSGAGAPNSTGFGNAGVFNGDSLVLFGFGEHPASFDLGVDDFTIAGWLKAPLNEAEGSAAANRPVFQSQSFPSGGWSFEIGRNDRSYAGEIFFTVGGGNSAVFSATQVFSDTRVDDDVWHWVAVVNNAGSISMFVDGTLQIDTGSMQEASTATAPPGTEAAFAALAGATFFEGELDEWSIYNHALTGTLSDSVLTGGELFDLWQQGVVVVAVPGDFDNDGDVDGRDFLAWQRGETTPAFSPAKLAEWQNAYNGGVLAGLNAVPEPSSLLMLALALPTLARRFRG